MSRELAKLKAITGINIPSPYSTPLRRVLPEDLKAAINKLKADGVYSKTTYANDIWVALFKLQEAQR